MKPLTSLNHLSAWSPDLCALVCIHIHAENHNVKSFTFQSVKPAYFEFLPGQNITLLLPIDGEEVARTYTIASSPTKPHTITITNKCMKGGVVTEWMHQHLKVGDQLSALSISGLFSIANDDHAQLKPLLLLSGGSGITPMLSFSRYCHDLGLTTDIAFAHHAQSTADFIAYEELQYYQNRHDHFHLHLACDNGAQDADWSGPSGFLNADMLQSLVPDFAQRAIYCCGPAPYMDNVKKILHALNYDMAFYHQESFDFAQSSAQQEEAPEPVSEEISEGVKIHLSKSNKTIVADKAITILQSLKKQGIKVPFACAQGVCGTCRTLKVSGDVDMKHQGGLLKKHEQQGYILICCSKPTTDLKLAL